MSDLKAKALKYLQLQDCLNALKCEIIQLTGVENRSLYFDLVIETRNLDIIDVLKLKERYPEAHRNCRVGTATVLKITRGGYHG